MHIFLFIVIVAASLYILYYSLSAKSIVWKLTDEKSILLPPGNYSIAIDRYLNRQALDGFDIAVINTDGMHIPTRPVMFVYSLVSRFRKLYCVAKFEIGKETELVLRFNGPIPSQRTRLLLLGFLLNKPSRDTVHVGVIYERSRRSFFIAVLLDAIAILLLAGKVL